MTEIQAKQGQINLTLKQIWDKNHDLAEIMKLASEDNLEAWEIIAKRYQGKPWLDWKYIERKLRNKYEGFAAEAILYFFYI